MKLNKKLFCLLALFSIGLTSCGYLDDQEEDVPVEEDDDKYYSVTFVNYDGSLLYSDYLKEGSYAEYKGTTPKKDKDENYTYEFSGWDKPFEPLVSDTKYTALFIQSETLKYTVSFYDYDGTLLYETMVESGETAYYEGEKPTRESDEKYTYEFIGWSKPLDNITKNTSVSAQYKTEKQKFVVKFFNYDNTLLDVETVFYGEQAFYHGVQPTRDSEPDVVYNFNGWDKELYYVTENLDVFANFSSNTRYYNVTFHNAEGIVICTKSTTFGGSVLYDMPYPDKPAHLNKKYIFKKWSANIDNVVSDLEVYPEYEESIRDNSYGLSFSYSYEGYYRVTGYSGYESDVYIGKTYNDGYNGEHPIKVIDDYVFNGNPSLQSIYMEDNITDIGYDAFGSCYNLREVVFSSRLEKISDYVFENCSQLNNVVLGDKVKSIGDRCFINCDSLTNFEISESNQYLEMVDGIIYDKVNKIAMCAVQNFLPREVTFKDGTRELAYEVLYQAEGVTKVTIPSSVEIINSYCFYNCSDLTEVDIQDASCSIDDSAFSCCYNLRTVNLGSKVKYLGYYCFSQTSISSLVIGPEVTFISDTAFSPLNTSITLTVDANNPNFYSFDNAIYNKSTNNLVVIGYRTSYTLILPKNFVLSSSIRSTLDNCNISTVLLEEGCVNYELKNNVLYSKDLTTLYASFSTESTFTMPDSVTTVGENAFYNLNPLKKVIINNVVTELPNYCFQSCYNLERITFGTALESIGVSCFYNCNSITTIDLSKTKVETIKDEAFQYCYKLNSVKLPDSIITLGDSCFYEDNALENVTFGSNLKNIGSYCFCSTNIKNADFSEIDLESIGSCAFDMCYHLSNVCFSEKTDYISNNAFYYCYSLRTVDFSNIKGDLSAERAFVSCNILEELIFGDSTIEFDNTVFASCTITKTVISPNLSSSSVIFNNCNIDLVELPAATTSDVPLFSDTTIHNLVVDSSAKKMNYKNQLFSGNGSISNLYFKTKENDYTNDFEALITKYYYPNVYYYSETPENNCWHYDEYGNISIWADVEE